MSSPLLALEGVSLRFGERRVLEGFDLQVAPGEFVALVGPNAIGKTSLLLSALGLHAPAAGRALLGGDPVAGLRGEERAARAAWLPQQGARPEPLPVWELVATSRYRFAEPRREARAAAERALAQVGVADLAERGAHTLSGGQQQRVALAAALAQEAPLLLLDEPANHLDPYQQRGLYRLLGELWRGGLTILCVTHEPHLLAEAGGEDLARIRVVGLAEGEKAWERSAADPELEPALTALFRPEGPDSVELALPPAASPAGVGLALALCALLVLVAPLLGPSLDGPQGAEILWTLRVPRVLMACLVGATLSLTGACFQALFENPLAAPSTVGTTAGATIGALAALVLGGGSAVLGLPVLALCAFAGAVAVSLFVTALAASGRARINDVLLAGIAVSLAASALSAGLEYAADMGALFAAVQWSLGQIAQVGMRGPLTLLPFVLVSVAGLLATARPLQTLVGGELKAHSQGVDLPRLRASVLGFGSLGVAACTAWCGPIAFVGLVVPHLVRLALGPRLRVLLPLSCCVGAAFLVACDAAARLLIPGRDLPVGVVTAALGAPALLLLVVRARARG
ncbi:MAG: iron chelate uptake ABC transporter family permease subunit [Planctomycetota bacterium]